jgi:hypothetical protein
MNPSRPSARIWTHQPSICAGLTCAALLSLTSSALAQFTDTNPGMAASAFGCVAPGDYDHDGNVDVLVMGKGSHDIAFTTLYHNVGGAFVDSGIPLLGLWPSSTSAAQSAAWGDFDQDGDLDLAMTGLTTAQVPTTRVYRNDGGAFTALPGNFLGEFGGAVTWADFDGDGDLDLLVTGITSPSAGAPAVTRLYRNDSGVFTSVPHPFQDAYLGPVAWADYDGDGDLDVLICGATSAGALTATLWRNQGGTFVDAGAGLPGLDLGEARWGDYDGDGDLDLLFGGNSNAGFITRIYRNDAGTLTDINAGLLPVLWSAAAWGDYDNDGDRDAMVIGYDPVAQASHSILYRNDGGSFVDSGNAFRNVYLGSVDWFDADNDGDFDLLLFGNQNGSDVLRLYRNDASNGPFPVASYCTAKTNSLGCLPAIGSSGLASMSASTPFTVSASNVVNQRNGLLFYGFGAASAPFQGGTMCVIAPTHRTPIQSSNGTSGAADCSGAFAYDFNALIRSGIDPALVAGAHVFAQYWYRDPLSASTTGLSNALAFWIRQ